MDTSLGKRNDRPVEADHQMVPPSASLFASIPDVSWQLIASLAAPPDVYNLSLSSKHFFQTGIALNRAGRKKRSCTIDATASDRSNKPSPLLATRLLRQSLLSSLGRVLDHSQSGITLDALADLPEGSAVISGSTMAQACLGVLWENGRRCPSDVDVFCSAKAAPQVRSWLVEKANCMFVGFADYCISMTDERLFYTVDTHIHHVEQWGSIIENCNTDEYCKKVSDEDMCTDIETLKQTEYYKNTTEWGKNCQRNYVDWKWKNNMCFDILDVDENKAYNIKPESGGDLPFDFRGIGNIDLIVARVNFGAKTYEANENSSEEITPLDLLEDFDLTICQASFDGKTFRIPDPHRTFSAKTTMEPDRRAVVESYVKHYKSPEKPSKHMTLTPYSSLEPMEQSALASSTIEAVRKDVPNAPFYKQLDFAACLPDRYTGRDFGIGSLYDPMVQAKFGAPIQFHNWTCKLIDRLRKYQQRGVEILGAPIIGDDVCIPQFYLEC